MAVGAESALGMALWAHGYVRTFPVERGPMPAGNGRLVALLAKLPEEPVPRLCLSCLERRVAYRGLGLCRRCYLRRTRKSDPRLFLAHRGEPCAALGCPKAARARSGYCKAHYHQGWHHRWRWAQLLRRWGLAETTVEKALAAVRSKSEQGWAVAERLLAELAAGRLYLARPRPGRWGRHA